MYVRAVGGGFKFASSAGCTVSPLWDMMQLSKLENVGGCKQFEE